MQDFKSAGEKLVAARVKMLFKQPFFGNIACRLQLKDVFGFHKSMALYAGLDPSRTTKEDVIRHAAGVFNFQQVFYTGSQTWNGIALLMSMCDIPIIMGHHDVVQFFWVNSSITYGTFCRNGGHVRSDLLGF